MNSNKLQISFWLTKISFCCPILKYGLDNQDYQTFEGNHYHVRHLALKTGKHKWGEGDKQEEKGKEISQKREQKLREDHFRGFKIQIRTPKREATGKGWKSSMK